MAGKTVNPNWTQEDYAFYSDGTESGAVIVGSAGAQQTLNVDTAYHCRLAISDTAGASNSSSLDLTCRWQYNLAAGGWNSVTGSSPLQFVDNANLTDGGTTTNRQPTGTGTFNAGRIYESSNDSAVVYSSPNDGSTTHTEVVLHFQIDSAQVTDGQEILVRCVDSGGTVYPGTYTNADIDVNEAVAYTLDADTHSFSITVSDVTLNRGYELDADTHAFNVSTSDVTLTKGVTLDADTHSFSLTTSDVGLVADRTLDADTHSFSITTSDVQLSKGKTLDADTLSFAVTPSDISVNLSLNFDADTHSFSVTPSDAGLNAAYNLEADTHAFTVSVSDVVLSKGKILDADTLSFSVTPSDAGLNASYNLDVDTIAFNVTTTGVLLDREIFASISGETLKELNALQFFSLTVRHHENATPTYVVKWSSILPAGVTISSSVWSTDREELTISNEANDDDKTSARFTASSPGTYRAVNTITDSNDLKDQRWLEIVFEDAYKTYDY